MANRAGPNDWLSADPVSDDGHVAYELNVNVVGGTGAPSDVTIISPLGTKTVAQSVAVTPATSSSWAVTGTFWQATQPVSGPQTNTEFLAALRSTTGTFSSVASAASSTTILASNANRKGATIVNTDANVLYVDLSGGTATSTRYAKALATGGEYEVPFGYTGLITGIWASDGAGSALVTEFT